ncbi:MAG: PKD domain-containing protein [bacterium]|nr:PKD domain-containing protein [bacterium]
MTIFSKHALVAHPVAITLLLCFSAFAEGPPEATRTPLVRAVELNVGESQEVELCDGTKAHVKLLSLEDMRDSLRDAVRAATVTVEVNGQSATLTCSTYHLPKTLAGVLIDCPITKGYLKNSRDAWGLAKDARLRLWPEGSPLTAPETFAYSVKQRWFASDTQMANEPTFVDGGEQPDQKNIYYHYGLDFGGAEGIVDVVAATDGLVVSAGDSILPGYENTPAAPRYDVIYVLDDQGWYYRYSHLYTIDPTVQPGRQVKMGQKIGVLGKEGGSGGWSHLHFDIQSRQPSGKWGTQEAYAFVWEAYLREYAPKLIAVARPHCLAWTGEKVTLDGTRSWSESGSIAGYDWTFCDGTTASGQKVERAYSQPGTYSEILKVADDEGRVAYDFAVVQIIDKEHPDQLPSSIHAVYAPTFGIKPGDPITFKVRTFRTTFDNETWDFGDGSPPVAVKSDGNVKPLAKDGYAVTAHSYEKPGDYIVRVERSNEHGHKAVGRLHVRVEANK